MCPNRAHNCLFVCCIGEGYSSKSSHIQTSDTQMLFKISNAKSEQSSGSMADNSITFARTHIPDLEIKFDKERARKGSARIKWWPCVTSAVIMLVMMSVLVSVLIYMNAFKIRSRKLTAGQLCHDKQQTGSCLSKGYCCGGQYVIGKDVCAGNGLCCLGPVTKCKGLSKFLTNYKSRVSKNFHCEVYLPPVPLNKYH